MRAVVTIVLCALATVSAVAADASLQPFHARYGIVWRGFNAGTIELELKRDTDDQFVYVSRANARGMFRAFFSDEITQTSWFSLAENGVRPLRYLADDGSDDTERDIRLEFDWRAARVRGTAEDKPVDVALEPGAQDAMSIQMALMRDLLAGNKPSKYRLFDKDKVKEYTYTLEGEARVKTALGELDTVIYRAERGAGSKRVTRMWYAPSLGFVGVRGEQLRDGKREWQMEIRSLERG